MSFYDTVYENVKRIPKGKVATYGQIAALCGSPMAARAVGYALHANPDPSDIPCHRVVNRTADLPPHMFSAVLTSSVFVLKTKAWR